MNKVQLYHYFPKTDPFPKLKTQGITILAVVIFYLSGCSRGDYSPEAYSQWMVNHRKEISDQFTTSGLIFSLDYLPADWLALREVNAESNTKLAKARLDYAGTEYYHLRLGLESGQGDLLQSGLNSTDEYYQRVEYFSFALQRDIQLVAGVDTLPCTLFHFERNYGAAPYLDFMVGFDERPDNDGDRTLLYNDIVFSNSLIKLGITAENFQNIPKLKL